MSNDSIPIIHGLPVKPIHASLAPTDYRKVHQQHQHQHQHHHQHSSFHNNSPLPNHQYSILHNLNHNKQFQHQMNQINNNSNAYPYPSSRSSSASSSSRNHPSPATSSGASSSASSLRTPPDLLLNPNFSSASSSIAGTPYLGFKHGGAFDKIQIEPPRFLNRSQIRSRLELINGLPSEPLSNELPSPPASPRRPIKAAGTSSTHSSRRAQQPKDADSSFENYGSSDSKSSASTVKGKGKERVAPLNSEDGPAGRSSQIRRRRDSSGSKSPNRDLGSNREHRSDSSFDGNNSSTNTASESLKRKRRASRSPARETEGSSGAQNRPSESSGRQHKRSKRIPLPKESSLKQRQWTKELYMETAGIYRRKGRDVKHSGDRRLRESSTDPSTAQAQASIAALEQTDALLHFVYGFWCEDMALGLSLAAKEKESRSSNSSSSHVEPYACVTTNWESLSGLLKYCIASHERRKDAIMVGLCRLIEALVLRHVVNHEQRMLNARLSKLVSESSESTSSLSEISRALSKATADLDRSSKLLQSARSSLSPSVLRTEAPRTWEVAIGEGMELDAKKEAGNIDPGSVGVSPDGAINSKETNRAVFAWPVEQSTPLSHVVAFGRRLIDEVARRRKLNFRLNRIESVQEFK